MKIDSSSDGEINWVDKILNLVFIIMQDSVAEVRLLAWVL